MAKKAPRRPRLPGSQVAPLADSPWYVRTIVWVGLPAAAAAYLLWFFIAQMTTRIDTLTTTLQQHKDDTFQLVNHLAQEREQAWVTAGTIAQICINTAGNDTAKKMACLSVPRRTP